MTEADWLSWRNPTAMLEWLRGRGQASDRKLRLFACACARKNWKLLRDDRSKMAVEVAERFADRLVGANRLATAFAGATEALEASRRFSPPAAQDAAAVAATAAHRESSYFAAASPSRPDHPDLLRELFGNPFRPAQLDPSARTAAVIALARAIYADGAFDRLPILADALEEAGCTNPEILGHCRRPEGHFRGCWVVDLVLGKS